MYLVLRKQLSRGERTAQVLWGGLFAVTALLFSYMQEMLHPYTVALAPAIAALIATGEVWSWRRRRSLSRP